EPRGPLGHSRKRLWRPLMPLEAPAGAYTIVVARASFKVGRIDDPIWSEPCHQEAACQHGQSQRWRIPAIAAAAVLLGGAGIVLALSRSGEGTPACEAVTASELRQVLDWEAGPPRAEKPETGPAGTGVCGYAAVE